MKSIDVLRQQCWDRAVQCFGSGYVCKERARRYRIRVRALTFLGIAVPVVAGVMVLSFGNAALSPWVLVPLGILGGVQVILSVLSLTAGWEQTYSYSLESLNANNRLANEYRKLAQNPPSSEEQFQLRFDLLEREDQFRSEQDHKTSVTEEELRMGMRAALREFQRKCVSCQLVPMSMHPTGCPVCGDFKRRRI